METLKTHATGEVIPHLCASLAQLAERLICNQQVKSSSLLRSSILGTHSNILSYFFKDLNHLAFLNFFKVPSLLFYKEEKTNEDF